MKMVENGSNFRKIETSRIWRRLNWRLEETANRVIFLEDIRNEVEKKKGLP